MLVRKFSQVLRKVAACTVLRSWIKVLGRASAAGALLVFTLAGLGCSSADEIPSGFIMDPRGVPSDMSGLAPGPIVFEFDIYAYGNADFATIENMPDGPFLLGKVGVGRLKPPVVKLTPVPGYPKARHLTATFDADTPGTYLVVSGEKGVSFDGYSPAEVQFAATEFKDPSSWPEPLGYWAKKYWTPFPLIRTVGPCRHPTVMTTIVSPAKNPGWYIEWSEPWAPGTPLPPFSAAPPKDSVDMPGTVTPTLVDGSDRVVYVPAPGGQMVSGFTDQAWDIPKTFGASLNLSAQCAPVDFTLPLLTGHQVDARDRLGFVPGDTFNETMFADLIAAKAGRAKAP